MFKRYVVNAITTGTVHLPLYDSHDLLDATDEARELFQAWTYIVVDDTYTGKPVLELCRRRYMRVR